MERRENQRKKGERRMFFKKIQGPYLLTDEGSFGHELQVKVYVRVPACSLSFLLSPCASLVIRCFHRSSSNNVY